MSTRKAILHACTTCLTGACFAGWGIVAGGGLAGYDYGYGGISAPYYGLLGILVGFPISLGWLLRAEGTWNKVLGALFFPPLVAFIGGAAWHTVIGH